jgi:hypothetical protein
MTIDALVAAAASPNLSFEGILLNLGLPGVIIIALGWYARSTINTERERARRLEEDNRRLYNLMGEQFVPALTKSNETINQAIAVMVEIQRAEEKKAAVEEARRLFEGRSQP